MKADSNYVLQFDTMAVTTEWAAVVVPIYCFTIELTGDQDWMWTTDTEGSANREVGKFIREVVIASRAGIGPQIRVCFVKSAQAGTLWRKFER